MIIKSKELFVKIYEKKENFHSIHQQTTKINNYPPSYTVQSFHEFSPLFLTELFFKTFPTLVVTRNNSNFSR